MLGGNGSGSMIGGDGAGGASTAAAGGEARVAAASGATAVSLTPSGIATGHGTTLVSCLSLTPTWGVHFISKKFTD
jgi:hypothetical protein